MNLGRHGIDQKRPINNVESLINWEIPTHWESPSAEPQALAPEGSNQHIYKYDDSDFQGNDCDYDERETKRWSKQEKMEEHLPDREDESDADHEGGEEQEEDSEGEEQCLIRRSRLKSHLNHTE